MLFIISTTIDYMHQLCFLYAKLSSHLLAVRESIHMEGTVFTLARLKIVPSYHQELVSHPMQSILKHQASLVKNNTQLKQSFPRQLLITKQSFPRQLLITKSRVYPAAVFVIIDMASFPDDHFLFQKSSP